MMKMTTILINIIFTCGGPLNRMDLGWYFPSFGFSSSFPLPSFPASTARSRADPSTINFFFKFLINLRRGNRETDNA